ncbi:hypothetical protein D3C81_2126170 [compost metagenome]
MSIEQIVGICLSLIHSGNVVNATDVTDIELAASVHLQNHVLTVIYIIRFLCYIPCFSTAYHFLYP